MSKQPPQILYKYRSFDARSISMLANNQIYFASPLDFNDPFDCVAHEHILDTQAKSIELLAYLNPEIPPEAITQENTERLLNAINQHPEINQIKATQEKSLKEFLENLGVLALSACNDSILMWSHYANYHKGFCIGFKNNLGLNDGCITEVNYSDSRGNDFVPYYILSQSIGEEETCNALLKALVFTKYIDWKYEQEWRAIWNKGTVVYLPDCIDRIIFGLKMPLDERNALRCILKGKNVKFFEMVKSKRHFAVEPRELDNN